MCTEPSDVPEVPNAVILPNVQADYTPDRLTALIASVRAKLLTRRHVAQTHGAGTLPSVPQLLKRISTLVPRATALLAPERNERLHVRSAVTRETGTEDIPIWQEASDIAAALDQVKYALSDELDEIIVHLLNLARLGDPWFETDYLVGLQPTWIVSSEEPAQGDPEPAYDHYSTAPWASTGPQASCRTESSLVNALALAVTPGVLGFRPIETFDNCCVSHGPLATAQL